MLKELVVVNIKAAFNLVYNLISALKEIYYSHFVWWVVVAFCLPENRSLHSE